MAYNVTNANWDEYLDVEFEGPVHRKRKRKFKSQGQETRPVAIAADDSREIFNPTFHSSKHERSWILTYLGPFYTEGFITDVLRQVKGGKEATVYCCQAHPDLQVPLVAAKVYRPRQFRNLRNDAVYRKGRETIGEEGKEVRGRREKLAMQKKTEFGQKLRHTTWLANEYETLRRLSVAGADVPKPFARNENAILMEYVGDGRASAPTLNQVRLSPREARPLFDRLVHNLAIMLANDCVHADLSAFNVLYWSGKATIIDLPQAVNPFVNSEAFSLFVRDVERLCQYFARYGIMTEPVDLAQTLWNRHIMRREPPGPAEGANETAESEDAVPEDAAAEGAL